MGASQPKPQPQPIINIEVKLNLNPHDTNQEVVVEGGAPAPASPIPIDIKTEVNEENGEKLPHNLKINQYLSNNNISDSLAKTRPSENDKSSIKTNNINNNNLNENNKEDGKVNKFSIFNSQNIADISNINNSVIPDINNQIDINENNNNYEIKNINNTFNENIINNNNKNQKKENNNDFMREGVNATKFGDEKEEKENNKPPTPFGEVDMNIGSSKNKKENEEEKKETDRGINRDMNQGNFVKEEYGEKVDQHLDINYSNSDLELSQSVIFMTGNNLLEQTQNIMKKGYFPLLLKIDNNEAMFLAIKETSPLKSLFKVYLKNCPNTDLGILDEIKIYHKKRLLNIEEQIENLNLQPLDIITNFMTD